MTALKDIYSPAFYNRFGTALEKVHPSFDKKIFIRKIFADGFEHKELKARMRHTTLVLHEFFPADFPEAERLIEKLIAQLRKYKFGEDGLAFMLLPDYIELYGLSDFENSVRGLEQVTQFVSCEFAVRPFIIKYGQQMIDVMIRWSKHENAKVRRLATEGSRSRLPWAMAIPSLKKDPSPIIPILENLKHDPSEFVRRSVANNLNDISKDNPAVVLKIAARWKGLSKETDAIIKHGLRTLLKQGDANVLDHYGLQSKDIEVSKLKISNTRINIGESLDFSFTVKNKESSKQVIRLEYAIYYQKKKGHLTKKVYKISERTYAPKEITEIRKKQKFVLITTRTFHPGKHQLSVIVNGKESLAKDFLLSHP